MGADMRAGPVGPAGPAAPVPIIGTHAARLAATPTNGQEWKESNSGLIYLGDGSAWQIYKGDGHIRKTADETVNNSAAVQNDDHLFFPVEANERWRLDAELWVSSASNTSDFKAGLSVPAGASYKIGNPGARSGVGTGTAPTVDSTTTISTGSAAGEYLVQLVARVTVGGTGGVVTLQWAQDTATPENTIVLTDSILRIRRLA